MSDEGFSVFILKLSKGSMTAAETYLRNRHWQVGSSPNMREALAYIIQKQPQYLLVAADHPNKKVKILPRLISQAFPTQVIVFAESTSPAAMNTLREMGLPYTLYPPVSGPAIERMVLKIKKEKEDKRLEQESSGRIGGGETQLNDDGTIRLKGESHSADSMQKTFQQARAALAALAGEVDSDEAAGPAYSPDHSESDNQGPSRQVAKGERMGASPNLTQEGVGAGDLLSAKQDGPNSTEYAATTKGPNAKDFNFNQGSATGEPAEDYPGKAQKPGFDPLSPEQTAATDLFPNFPQQPEESDWKGIDSTDKPHSANKKGPPVFESDPIKTKERKALYVRGEKIEQFDNESLVIKGSIEALDSTVITNDSLQEHEIQKVESASNVACITIESPRFSGYLVAALGKNRKIDQDFIDTIKKRLFSFLKANGELTVNEDPMGIKIKEVEFEDWAIEQAEFLKKSVHHGDEIAMAFFPNKDVSTKLEESASETMVKMSLDEIRDDVALEFDLYMYLPENKKYLLYTAQGNPILQKQKGRLQEKGITHMHLRKEAIGDVKKYRAQNYLNEKIESYKLAKKSKG